MAAVLAVAASALLTAPYASGGLLVSSTFTNDVKRYNGTTGAFIDNFASGGGLDGSIGLAFGPDGNLYVGSFYTDSVKRYDGTTGAFIDDFASGGGLDGTGELIFSPVPEPAAIATGLLCLGVAALRRRRRA